MHFARKDNKSAFSKDLLIIRVGLFCVLTSILTSGSIGKEERRRRRRKEEEEKVFFFSVCFLVLNTIQEIGSFFHT